MQNFQRFNNIIGWIIFTIASYVYLSTMEATVSLWDCGEYISTAYKLEVGHPPGAPLFQMIGRFFTLFAFGDVTKVAVMINSMSALCSALTILFLFWSITALLKKIANNSEGGLTQGKAFAILGSGIVGALAYTFSDSFWFSAVEGEVYAMSSFFTALVFWAMLKWEQVADEEGADRWIIFIAYLIGLSVGVHLLNLLAVPAVVFIYYYKKYDIITRKGFLITGALSILLLGGIQSLIIPGIVNLAANFELFFVNKTSLPFNSGTIIYFIMLISLLIAGIMYTHRQTDKLFTIVTFLGGAFLLISLASASSLKAAGLRAVLGGAFFLGLFYVKRKGNFANLNTILLSFTVLIIGYSSFIMLVIRSQANPPIDENNPENAINMLAYLNREQYGDNPLLYGHYYNAPQNPENPFDDGDPVYIRNDIQDNTSIKTSGVDGGPTYRAEGGNNGGNDQYIISDDRKSSIPVYDPAFCTIFPRMWSQQSNHEAAYKSWGKIDGEKITVTNGRGEKETIIKPTFLENMTYFVNYQVNFMYFRYFFWNFVGRQNDIQGHGNSTDGNWYSGISFIDGDDSNLPDSMAKNKGRNSYYALPLILGLIGLFFQFTRANKDAFVVFLLFFFTGLAIVIYLNQYPYQPRERDYAFTASFYAFAIWIGIGVYAIFDLLKGKLPDKIAAVGVTALCLFAVPSIMARENWDDHDRSNRYTARDFARNYLESCAPNAILFTNGDNDTFPLWYVQEVEGIRTDVRVVNLSLLNTDWYIDQMKRKAYDSDPVPFSLSQSKYRQGTRDWVPFYDKSNKKQFYKAKEVMDFISSDDKNMKLEMQNGRFMNFLPTKNLSIPVDTNKVIANKTVDPRLKNRLVPAINWTLGKNMLMKNDMMVLDLLANNNWERPIYFAVTTGPDSYMDLQDYFQLEGLAYRLVPVKNTPEEQQAGARVSTDIMYDNIMNKFTWGNINAPGIYVDENVLRMAMNLRIQMGALASALVAENKKDSAVKVIDKCIEMLPEENVQYDATVFSLTVGYYQADAFEKGNKLSKRLFDIYEQEYIFYTRRSDASSFTREVRQAQEMMQRLSYLAQSFKQDVLAKEFDGRARALGLQEMK